MIDINCHILPGLDGGPSSITESIAMVRQAAKQGVKKIVATPLKRYKGIHNRPEDIIAAVDYMNYKFHEEKVPVNILPGQKVMINSEIVEDLKNGAILPMNETSQYITIELPQEHIPYNLEEVIYDILMGGYVPVISNPEEHFAVHDNPNLLYRAVKNGALCSIAAGSIVGAKGKKTQKLAEKLLEAEHIHFVSSNARTKQGFYIAEAVSYLNKHYPGLSYQFLHNSESLIRGDTIPKNEPYRIESKKWSIFGK